MGIPTRSLLLTGAFMPVIYFVALFSAGALFPDYSHFRQVPSDLGADGSPYAFAAAFNFALLIVGLTGLIGALGLVVGLWKLGVNRFLSMASGMAPAMPSISLMMSALFPLPSPYHSSFVLLLIGMLTPLLGGLALRKLENTVAISLTLYLAFVVAVIVVGIIFGIGDLITEDNVGLWIRIWAVVSLPTSAILCLAVRAKLP
jgi:hypothetical membrane protein